jgi:SAM-dependent methyltransferase
MKIVSVFKQIFLGLISYIPLLHKNLAKIKSFKTGGTNNADYCISVFFKHAFLNNNDSLSMIDKDICEVGPGDSIGVGICALIFGAKSYTAFDSYKFMDNALNIDVFNKITQSLLQRNFQKSVELIKSINPKILTINDNLIIRLLSNSEINNEARINYIKWSIENINQVDSCLHYFVGDWDQLPTSKYFDVIICQSVFEYFQNMSVSLKALKNFLKPNGIISTQIDYRGLQFSDEWYSHWGYPDYIWNLIKGKRPMVVNRLRHSQYLDIFSDHKLKIEKLFEVKAENKHIRNLSFYKEKNISLRDLKTSGAYFLLKNQ